MRPIRTRPPGPPFLSLPIYDSTAVACLSVCHRESGRRFFFIPNFLSSKSSTFSIPVFVAVFLPDSRLGFIFSEPSLGFIPGDPRIPDSRRTRRGSQDPSLGFIPCLLLAGIPDSRGSQTDSRLGFRPYRCCCRTDILLFFNIYTVTYNDIRLTVYTIICKNRVY